MATIQTKWPQHIYVALTYYGKVLTEAELRLHWGKPLHEMICIIYETDDVQAALRNIRSCHDRFPKSLFPTTVPFLQRMRAQGKLTGLVTATSAESFGFDLRLVGFPIALLDYVQTADDTQIHKPDPCVFDPAIAWLAKHGIARHEALYVGVSLNDMRAAMGAGLQFIGVETGLFTGEEFQQHGAHSVPDLGHLL